ncbi:LamG-like jellyroll fold domain-containing protein, partial [uncultured Nitrospira sp.]|uniref:beta strand repeat-containing protein n=1 Tax=uncultured Nitrospira sp. TaxID=157176 RepID=UPI0031405100
DTIDFSIAGAGPHTINVLSALPTITEAVLIDGWSEPDYVSGTPVIELNGGNLGSLVKGLDLGSGSDGSTIRGLIINRFTGTGIEISGSDSHTIQGNWIGLNSAGTGASANGVNGIFALNSTDNLIGGTTATQRNVISGNTQQGIFFDNVDNSTISGNYIGTNVSGTGDINGTTSNTQQTGVYLSNGSSGNVIGGTTGASRNVISGNNHYGFEVIDSGSQNNLLQGNYIGTTVTGLAALGNVDGGASFWRAGTGNVFGGSAVGAGNVISGNLGHGVLVGDTTTGATIQGNLIGITADGVAALGNVKAGIQVQDTASSTTIGGTAAGQGNTIGFNGRDGIYISGGSGISILGNSIYSNVELGIDLGTNGITANDVGDGDTGPNNLQNFPVVTSANSNATGTTLIGTLNTNASLSYRIEFFASRPTIADSPNGEGERYLGFTTVTTDGSGDASFNLTLNSVWINAGDRVTATATRDLGGGNYGDTSEFAANVTATSTGIVVVDTTSDVGDGTTTSITNLGNARGADGRISLREAIIAANLTTGADKIVFAIPHTDTRHYYYTNNSVAGTVSTGNLTATTAASDAALVGADPDYAKSWWSIQVAAAGLPAITTQMTIDAWTQTGFSGTPIIELNGSLVSNGDPNGFTIETSSTTIRGFAINRFGDDAIEIDNQGGSHTIVGNYLGTDVSGLVTTYGNRYGMTVKSDGNTIGGTTAADRNIIAGNSTGGDSFGIGFWQDADNNLVQGNYIGVGADGTTGMSNRQGITFQGTADNNKIGGETLGAGNVIAFNSQNGVDVIAGTNNAIIRNSIHSNGLLGINLGTAGVTANDNGDGDSGANNLQNFPVLTTADLDSPTQVTIEGTFNSTASTTFRIEFYKNTVATGQDPSSHGEGQTYLGFTSVTTDGSGNGSFNVTLTAAVTAGEFVTATATRDLGGGNYGSTSEFALNITAAAVNDAPVAADDRPGLVFDGVDDFLQLGSDASLEMTNTMTMEAWFRPTSLPTSSSMILLNKEGEYEVGILSDGTIRWAFANTDPGWTWHNTGHVVTLNEWTHVAITHNSGVVITYVNGSVVETYNGSGSIGDVYPVLEDFRIGGRSNNPTGQYFEGSIGEVRIWNTVRTAGEISTNYDLLLTGNESGLVGNWLLREGSGTTATDISSSGNDGTLGGGMASQEPTWVGYSTDQDTPLNIAASGVLVNDVDVDSDPLVVSEINGSAANVGNPIALASGALVTLNADGSFTYDPNGQFDSLTAGQQVSDQFTYTADDGNGGTDTGTVDVTVTGVNDIPVLTNLGGDTLAYTEGDGAQVLDQSGNAAVSDVDSSDFDTGTLTVAFTAGSDSAEDVLAIRDQGAGPTNITVAGSAVSYGGTQIGTFVGGSSGAALVITLEANADAAAVSALVQNITYTNTDTANPTLGSRTVRYVLTDGDGGTSANYDTTVTFSAVNDLPVLTNLGGDTLAYTEGDG